MVDSFPDLDKGGNYGWVLDQMAMGPTKGRVNKANRVERIITSGAASALQKWDAVILLNLTIAAAYSLTLPTALDWLSKEHGQIEVLVKFLNDNGGNDLTILPSGADTIDGIASVAITAQVGLAPFPSLRLRPRIDLLGWIVT